MGRRGIAWGWALFGGGLGLAMGLALLAGGAGVEGGARELAETPSEGLRVLLSVLVLLGLIASCGCAGLLLRRWRQGRLRSRLRRGWGTVVGLDSAAGSAAGSAEDLAERGGAAGVSEAWIRAAGLGLASFLGVSLLVGVLIGVGAGGLGGLVLLCLLLPPALLLGLLPLRDLGRLAIVQGCGLHCGRGLLRELTMGVVCYLAALPALLVLAACSAWLAEGREVSHPVQELLLHGDRATLLVLLVAVALVVPAVEELLFRGYLQRHLRCHLGPWPAGLLGGLVFAMVHPQGWVAWPVLGGVGLLLSLIRDWRGSLVAPLAAHALHNGGLLALALLTMRG